MLCPLAGLLDSFHQISRANLLPFGFAVADKINIGHDCFVGLGEAGGEILEQKACSTVLMRLKDAEQTLGLVFFSNRFQCGTDFCRMMSVIVYDDGSVEGSDFAHSPINTGERADFFSSQRRIDAAGGARGDGDGGVEEIVQSRHGKANRCHNLSLARNLADMASIFNADRAS